MKRLRCLGSDDKVSRRKTKVQSIKVEVSWLGLYGRCVRVEVSGFICKDSGNRLQDVKIEVTGLRFHVYVFMVDVSG